MPHPPPDITLALSQFFQNDDPGLALAHVLQADVHAGPTQQQPPAPDTVAPASEPACA
jgi:hypothetical protein